jgi:hypothetical protein
MANSLNLFLFQVLVMLYSAVIGIDTLTSTFKALHSLSEFSHRKKKKKKKKIELNLIANCTNETRRHMQHH